MWKVFRSQWRRISEFKGGERFTSRWALFATWYKIICSRCRRHQGVFDNPYRDTRRGKAIQLHRNR